MKIEPEFPVVVQAALLYREKKKKSQAIVPSYYAKSRFDNCSRGTIHLPSKSEAYFAIV